MAQPTQQFPPWLSPSAFIVTDAAGDPIATETSVGIRGPDVLWAKCELYRIQKSSTVTFTLSTVLQIPLGTLYSFGGSSEPATVILPSPYASNYDDDSPSFDDRDTFNYDLHYDLRGHLYHLLRHLFLPLPLRHPLPHPSP